VPSLTAECQRLCNKRDTNNQEVKLLRLQLSQQEEQLHLCRQQLASYSVEVHSTVEHLLPRTSSNALTAQQLARSMSCHPQGCLAYVQQQCQRQERQADAAALQQQRQSVRQQHPFNWQ
jgi:hypothetical protein